VIDPLDGADRRCDHVIVAVPTRDESATITGCLRAIDRAAMRVRVRVPVTITVADLEILGRGRREEHR
jgi:hypothetical protein